MVWPMNYREVSREANRARTAIENANWEGLRYCGNRFERGQYYREAWKALAAGVEGKAHPTAIAQLSQGGILPPRQGPQPNHL